MSILYTPCSELEIKGTTESSTSASYLDVLLNIDSGGKLKTQLYDKRDDFNFAIVNFPYTCSNIPLSPAYGVYISTSHYHLHMACISLNLFDMQGPAPHTSSF